MGKLNRLNPELAIQQMQRVTSVTFLKPQADTGT